MKRQPLLECTFLIPLRGDKNLSDGKEHEPDAWEWLKKELFRFRGGSRRNATVSGYYPDPDTGTEVWDESWEYFVAIPRWKIPRLRSLLVKACDVFHQKVIYLSVAGRVEFVGRRGHAKP
jgi:hypothetical protein